MSEDPPAPARLDAGTLYRKYAGFVRNYLLRHGTPPDEIPDLLQEVFLIAHRKGGFQERTAKPSTWLIAIAMRVASDHRRRASRRRTTQTMDLESLARLLAPDLPPDDRVQLREQVARVRRALRMLHGSKRSVFVMYEIEGRSCQEIARRLRIPVGTVYSRLHHARKEFLENYQSSATEKAIAMCESESFITLGVQSIGSDP